MYEQRFLLLSSLAGANNKIEPTNWSLFCVGYRRRRPWGSNVTKLEKRVTAEQVFCGRHPVSDATREFEVVPFACQAGISRLSRDFRKAISGLTSGTRESSRGAIWERLGVRLGGTCEYILGFGASDRVAIGPSKKSLAATGPGEKSKFPYSPVVINTIYNRTERISFYTSPRGETNMKRCKTVAQEEEKNPVVLVNVDIRPLVHSPR
jgi:hypothetical protein